MGVASGLYSQDKDPVSGLTARQRDVLRMLSGVEGPAMTQNQVADRLGISRQRVRQIVETLLAKGIELPGAKPPKT